MQENVFTEILMFNIIDSDEIINKEKELRLSTKIIDFYTKYKYYKYKFFHDDDLFIKLFSITQKNYFVLYNFIKKIKYKKSKNYNSEDLFGEIITNNGLIFTVYIDKFLYNFTYNDFNKLMNASLLNYETIDEPNTIGNIFYNPKKLNNPYTNLEFKSNVLYNFHTFCINNNLNISIYHKIYYINNFDIKNLYLYHEDFLTIKSLFHYIKNMSSDNKYLLLIRLVNIFNDFILKYINGYALKYLLANFKMKFYNIDTEDLKYYDNFLYKFCIIIHYYKNKQTKNYVNCKIKLMLNILCDSKIKLIDENTNNFFVNNLSIEKIMNYLM